MFGLDVLLKFVRREETRNIGTGRLKRVASS